MKESESAGWKTLRKLNSKHTVSIRWYSPLGKYMVSIITVPDMRHYEILDASASSALRAAEAKLKDLG